MMEHKAFVFDYVAFEQELLAVLEDALRAREWTALAEFINANLGSLTDPYEGEELKVDWESLVEIKDVHQYGDFALTKFYSPLDDIGLGTNWEHIQEVIAMDPVVEESPILGSVIGTTDDPFDPGKMGSYFQSPRQVARSHAFLMSLAKHYPSTDLTAAMRMLEEAISTNRGLYVTF